jgi:Putative peptidoglycan binding domain
MAREHVVLQGEDLIGIAGRFGFPDVGKLEQANPDLDRRPGILQPGDKLTIPDRSVTKLDATKETKNAFRLTSPTRKLQIPIQDGQGQPLANMKYTLGFACEQYLPRDGTTDGGGVIALEVSWKESEVVVAVADTVVRLRLGHLNPMDGTDDGGVPGIAQRLTLLGYRPGPLTGSDEQAMRAALEAFQHDSGLEPTGEADADTLKKLDARANQT